jgi:DNA-binding MarR family transcriptional regulator
MAKRIMKQDRETLVRHIMKLSVDIYRAIKPIVPPEWLTSDLTVAQLRVLLLLHAEGSIRMSSLASSLGIAVSTATGIVDNLVRKGLVGRGVDPQDRRLVICELSSQGKETLSRLWTLGEFQVGKLLHGLSLEQLKKAAEVAEFLLSNVTAEKEGI